MQVDLYVVYLEVAGEYIAVVGQDVAALGFEGVDLGEILLGTLARS